MTEAAWLACEDPLAMLDHIGLIGGEIPLWYTRSPADRKLRLFAAACCRSVFERVVAPDRDSALDAGERYADDNDEASAHRLNDLCSQMVLYRNTIDLSGAEVSAAWLPVWVVNPWGNLVKNAGHYLRHAEVLGLDPRSQADLVREAGGNPFRPVTLAPS